MKTYSFAYGSGTVELPLDEKNVIGELHGNVCVVGDDAQSIYSFRGAKIENILRFQQDFPGAKLFKLEQNYRSAASDVYKRQPRWS